MGLIWVQTVCTGYQQTAQVGKELVCITFILIHVNFSDFRISINCKAQIFKTPNIWIYMYINEVTCSFFQQTMIHWQTVISNGANLEHICPSYFFYYMYLKNLVSCRSHCLSVNGSFVNTFNEWLMWDKLVTGNYCSCRKATDVGRWCNERIFIEMPLLSNLTVWTKLGK